MKRILTGVWFLGRMPRRSEARPDPVSDPGDPNRVPGPPLGGPQLPGGTCTSKRDLATCARRSSTAKRPVPLEASGA
jgi:hypothetical protein